MKIPQYEQQINPQSTQLGGVSSPGVATKEAFSFGVGEAIEKGFANAANTAGAIGDVLNKRYQQQAEIKVTDLETQYMAEQQNILHNPDTSKTKTVKIGGVDKEVPDALYNRYGHDTNGATNEFVERDFANMQSKAAQLNGIYRAKLQQSMMARHLSAKEGVIDYESKQLKIGDSNTITANNKLLEFDSAANPGNLGLNLLTAIKNEEHRAVRLGLSSEETDVNKHKVIEDILWKATESELTRNGLDSSKELLNDQKLKGIIPEDLYKTTEDKLNSAKARIDSVNKSVQIERDIQSTLGYLDATKNGTVNWSNVDETVREANKINPKLGQAIKKISMMPPDVVYRGTNIDDMSFASSAEVMFKMNDNKALNDYLLDVIRQSPGGNLSSEKMTILLSLARNQAIANNPKHPQNQAVKEDNNYLQNVLSMLKFSAPGFYPQMAIELLTRKFKKNLTGEQLKLEGQKVQTEILKKNIPAIRDLNGVPNKIIYGDGPTETIYNGANQLSEEDNGTDTGASRESSNEF